jgi:hypothetical protein
MDANGVGVDMPSKRLKRSSLLSATMEDATLLVSK